MYSTGSQQHRFGDSFLNFALMFSVWMGARWLFAGCLELELTVAGPLIEHALLRMTQVGGALSLALAAQAPGKGWRVVTVPALVMLGSVWVAAGAVLVAPWWFYGAIPALLVPYVYACALVGRRLGCAGRRYATPVLVALTWGFISYAFWVFEPVTITGAGAGVDALLDPAAWIVRALLGCAWEAPLEALLPAMTLFTGALFTRALTE